MNKIKEMLSNIKLPKFDIKFDKLNIKLPKVKFDLTFFSLLLLALCHIAIIVLVILSYRYYAIYPSVFISAIGIVLIFLIIIDIILFVGINHKDKILKIIACILAFLIFVSGVFGSFYLAKVNSTVKNILDGDSNRFETVSGVFVCYKEEYDSLEDLDGKRIGLLTESTPGISTAAQKILDDAKLDYAPIFYNSYSEIFQDLADGDIEVGLLLNGYRSLYENDETTNFAKYLEDMHDVYSFEETISIDQKTSSKKLDTDPFNVLLIGWSRTELGSSIGLADAIIVATINPQTYTVSMLSIARDSFVPIPCYGGESDKINSGRSISRPCFIETVENFLGMEMDFYMEADYDAVIRIVNRIDGIDVYNPVAFELDGAYVPQGYVHLDGVQALQFCRERHSMPNGDFDRQQHQKEVILQIIKKFIERGDISFALAALEAAADQMSTNLTLSQLTGLFNLVLNTENYTGLDTFDLIDFHQLRITGNGGLLYYSYAMRLPLWVYLVYQGSLDESVNHIHEVMDEAPIGNQYPAFEFSSRKPYNRDPFYSLSYEDKYVYTPDPMPAYWITLEGLSQGEAMSWASANGVSLSVVTINPDDPSYNASYEGMVLSQSVRYGSLVSEYRSGTITVMGTGELDPDRHVPNFVGSHYSEAISWANAHGVYYEINWNEGTGGDAGQVLSQSHPAYTPIENVGTFIISVKRGVQEIKFNANGHGSAPDPVTVKTGEGAKSFPTMPATDGYNFLGWFTEKSGGKQVSSSDDVTGNVTLYAHWGCASHEWDVTEPTCEKDGQRVCKKCGEKEKLDKLGHDFSVFVENKKAATCEEVGSDTYKCSRCDKTKAIEIPALGHDFSVFNKTVKEATCEGEGSNEYKCSRCDKTSTVSTSPLGHDYSVFVETKVAATCDQAGVDVYKCSRCDSTKEVETPATGGCDSGDGGEG